MPRIHTNAIYNCLTVANPRTYHANNYASRKTTYLLTVNILSSSGMLPMRWEPIIACDIELFCYIWHAIAGPILHYINDPLLEFWIPEAIYTTASNFIWNHEANLCMEDQTTLIPWVQSIVIKHYVLGK
jgi:hypothetical protein